MKWVWIVLAILLAVILLGRPLLGRDTLTTLVSGPPTLLQSRESTVRAATIAEAYWGGTRCLHVSYSYKDLPGRTIAQARWYSSKLADGVYFRCSVTFDPGKTRVSFALYCGAVVHEFGHLSGFKHVKDPNAIMYSRLSATNIPKVCR